ncbi:hypothetical protein [Flavobacterium sp.]|uniref:hypothetical protein n=1 Tax=Flavobacterium sp. TaxID=239 RepID=UPI00261C9005|nr:hypothetical protein [Flavobacterium sp.]
MMNEIARGRALINGATCLSIYPPLEYRQEGEAMWVIENKKNLQVWEYDAGGCLQ